MSSQIWFSFLPRNSPNKRKKEKKGGKREGEKDRRREVKQRVVIKSFHSVSTEKQVRGKRWVSCTSPTCKYQASSCSLGKFGEPFGNTLALASEPFHRRADRFQGLLDRTIGSRARVVLEELLNLGCFLLTIIKKQKD